MKRYPLLALLTCLTAPACTPEEPGVPEPSGLEVSLEVRQPEDGVAMRWSPKGEKLPLTPDGAVMTTTLHLGQPGALPVRLRLAKSDGQPYFDRLSLDRNHDARFEDDEILTAEPREIRGSTWSTFDAYVDLPTVDPWTGEATEDRYALSFWYVEDPRVENPEQVIRFSRRGWMEGRAVIDGVEAAVLVAESVMDGVYNRQDSWALAEADSAANVYDLSHARAANRHAWLLERAYGIAEIDPSGRKLVLTPVDPGVTRAEEAAIEDQLAVDRQAARSGRVVAFMDDYEEAEARARREGKPLFIDFETVWCGPCHTMDRWVYTADAVVDASGSYVSVKVDGDERRDLTDRFEVQAYPTMIILAPDGAVVRRTTSYQGVAPMTAFLAGP